MQHVGVGLQHRINVTTQARNLAPLHSPWLYSTRTCDEDEVEEDASHAISLA